MFIFHCISIIIFSYLSLSNGTVINKIQYGRIINSTSTFQSNCSTCICQCMTYMSLSSSICCYVNCYTTNNTCQVIISSSVTYPAITIDTKSTIYKTNCSIYSTTPKLLGVG
ncbi:unnamed protein product [Adineta steineri]|uniref:Uncharacterized protein n=1 Tax=Adineta steineri TaxID=433720 RepID=A0A813Z6C9_9BILA|nr:unnamed protein product [Adineta steineri]CAF1524325.1 unnamed protein product [Adineta steineri]CAF1556189.1 unnamed protein product [Adineta steineri]CAF1651330.1 unnamed protein product [Adineta steineri]